MGMDKTRHDKTRQDKTRQDKTDQGKQEDRRPEKTTNTKNGKGFALFLRPHWSERGREDEVYKSRLC